MTTQAKQILLIDDMNERQRVLQIILTSLSYEVIGADQFAKTAMTECEAIIVGQVARETLLDELATKLPNVPVLEIDNVLTERLGGKSLKARSVGSITTPFTYVGVLSALHLCQQYWQTIETQKPSEPTYAYEPLIDLVGTTPVIRRVFHMMRQVAKSDVNVLILGASGTGKEMVARNLHDLSNRRDHI